MCGFTLNFSFTGESPNKDTLLYFHILCSTFTISPLETTPTFLMNTLKMWSLTQVKLSKFGVCILSFGLGFHRASSLSTNTLTKMPDRSTISHDFCKSMLRICSWSGFGSENVVPGSLYCSHSIFFPRIPSPKRTISIRQVDGIIGRVSTCLNMTSN